MERKVKLGIQTEYLDVPLFGLIGMFFFINGLKNFLSIENPVFYEDYTLLLGGCIFIIIPLIRLICLLRRRKRLQTIFSGGKYLWGEVTEIVEKNFTKINYHYIHIYHLSIQYRDRDGNVHTFRSRSVFSRPEESVIGLQVKVYYEDDRYKHYYVDLENVLL